MKKVLFSLFVLAGFAACTSDDVVISDSTGITSDTAEAYLTVNIRYADEGGGTRAQDGGLKDAPLASEYAVNDAYFYFYDEDGLFVSRAEVWDGGATVTPEDDNIQFKSNTVVVLKGLTGKGFPRYMVTVLNEPSGFENGYGGEFHEPAGTLGELQEKLAYGTVGAYTSDLSFNANAGIQDANDNFVMSTTSFVGPDADNRGGIGDYYFTTRLNDADFYEEPVDENVTTAVDVYVERLAAKVSATYDNTNATQIQIGEDEYIYAYAVEDKVSIAGEANENDNVRDEADEYEGDETIYIALDGWKLNATARQSYIVKNINTAWDYTWGGGDTTYGWNDTANSRSYWGMAYLWDKEGDTQFADGDIDQHNGYAVSPRAGQNEYPTVGEEGIQAGNYDADELNSETWLNSYVKYTSLKEGTLNSFTADMPADAEAWNDYEYCAENTNTVGANGIVDNIHSSAITSALIKATAYTYDEATGYYTNQTLFRYNGMLFTEAAFLAKMEEDVTEAIDNALTDDFYYEGGSIDYGDISFNDLYYTDDLGDEISFSQDRYPSWFETNGYTLTKLIQADDFSWTATGDGIKVTYNDTGYQEGDWLWWYHYESGIDTYVYTLIREANEGDQIAKAIADINQYLDENTNVAEIPAYVDGKMYYSVPIEHLNNVTSYVDEAGETVEEIQPGNYGVVRNHWYNLSINGVTNIGKGITDDDEVIVPEPEDPTYYYVQATINILSWKQVNQGVTLGQY